MEKNKIMEELNVDWRIKLGNKIDYGIGVVGCGGIVQYAHLPAYKKAGFRSVAVYDIDKDKAEAVAQEFNIPNAYDSLDDLLAFHKSHDGLATITSVPLISQYGTIDANGNGKIIRRRFEQKTRTQRSTTAIAGRA